MALQQRPGVTPNRCRRISIEALRAWLRDQVGQSGPETNAREARAAARDQPPPRGISCAGRRAKVSKDDQN
jgi:hypothetical protein